MSNDNKWLHDLRKAFIKYNNEEFDVSPEDELLTLATANEITESSTIDIGYTTVEDHEDFEVTAVIDLDQKQLITSVKGANYEEQEVVQYQSYEDIVEQLQTCSFDDFMYNDLDYDKIVKIDKQMSNEKNYPFDREYIISWLQKNQEHGAFDGFMEENMVFQNLHDEELEYYFDEWISEEEKKEYFLDASPKVELYTYDGTFEVETEWLENNIEGMEIDEFLNSYTWDEAEWLRDLHGKESNENEKGIPQKSEPDMEM